MTIIGPYSTFDDDFARNTAAARAGLLPPLDLRGPRDACGPDCDRFIAKWEAWWDAAFSETNRPAMLATPPTHDAYLKLIGSKSRNMLVKARRCDVVCSTIEHDAHLDELHAINRSMPVRSGGAMRPAYMIRPPAIGPAPQLCGRHRSEWIGALIGEGAEPFRLVAYCHLIVANELAVINTILGHGDYLKYGIMNALVADLARRATNDDTIRYTNYLTLHGPERLSRFKRSVGFATIPIDRRRDL